MRKRSCILLGVIFFILGVGFSKVFNTITGNNLSYIVQPQEYNSLNKISYDKYQSYFEYLSKNINIDGLNVKYCSKHDSISIFDSKWSFGTRNQTLIDVEEYNLPAPTQEYVILEDNSQENQVLISICYSENFIGNDLHSMLFSNNDLENINHELDMRFNSLVLSYNNLIIHVQEARNNIENLYINEVVNEVVDITEKYF